MGDTLTEEELNHPLNEAVLKKASKIKQEKEVCEDRLVKLDASKKGVSESVYTRVRKDYMLKLDEASQKFEEARKDIDNEIVALAEKKLKINESLSIHKEKTEEAKLRESLGEYSSEEFQKISKTESAEIKRLESALKEISSNLSKFEILLKGEDEGAPKPKKATTPPPVPQDTGKTADTHPEAVLKKTPVGESTAKVKVGKPAAKSKEPPKIIIMENGKTGQTISVEQQITIGRSPSNEIVLKEPKVSRQHAQIQILGDKYVLLDLESSNGTYVAGKKISEHILQANDEIRVGKTTMVFKV